MVKVCGVRARDGRRRGHRHRVSQAKRQRATVALPCLALPYVASTSTQPDAPHTHTHTHIEVSLYIATAPRRPRCHGANAMLRAPSGRFIRGYDPRSQPPTYSFLTTIVYSITSTPCDIFMRTACRGNHHHHRHHHHACLLASSEMAAPTVTV